MEQVTKRGRGRPEVSPAQRKRNRAISLTNGEYAKLQALAAADGARGVSAFVIARLKLS